jgi:hypothetical protein
LALFRFYLPRSMHHGCCLFDDVDVPRLTRYLSDHGAAIGAKLGPEAVTTLQDRLAELVRHQTGWKCLPRTRRGIAYCVATGQITAALGDWYADRPYRWHLRFLGIALAWSLNSLARAAVAAWRLIRQSDIKRLAWTAWRCISSQRFRRHIAWSYVARRIGEWSKRRFIDKAFRRKLFSELNGEEATTCIADFGAHLAIKTLTSLLQWYVFPALFLSGIIGAVSLVFAMTCVGVLGRTAYTTFRIVQGFVRNERRPWIALLVGLLPFVGDAAFGVQLLQGSADAERHLPRFILFDTLARVGRCVPIWGGKDSLTEGWFNRLPTIFRGWAPFRGASSTLRQIFGTRREIS